MHKWKKNLRENGFAMTRISLDFDEAYIESVIGKIDTIKGVGSIQTISPRLGLGVGPSYSDNFGLAEFPFHTDMAHWSIPPRYFVLVCVSGSSKVTTDIIHRDQILNSHEQVECATTILRARRPLDGRQTPLRMLSDNIFRWDEIFLEPVNRSADYLVNLIKGRLGSEKSSKILLEEPGQALIVDNWRTVHGRSAVPPESKGRVIKRIYIENII